MSQTNWSLVHFILTQVDEHSLDLYVVTPNGIAVTQRVHAAKGRFRRNGL
ncbi:MAG: hypothetical protein M3Z08_02180 [Chloroflexota bacterium]|nr:hypothetical protein [Chloroflexota bacterium]